MARKHIAPLPSTQVMDQAYKGYLIQTHQFAISGVSGQVSIKKDGYHISYATTDYEAREIINQLA